jgi:flavin-binding protein dodecin
LAANKLIERAGTSPTGVEDTVNHAIARAVKTVQKLRWFEVGEIRGTIDGDAVSHWQVTIKLGFTLDA